MKFTFALLFVLISRLAVAQTLLSVPFTDTDAEPDFARNVSPTTGECIIQNGSNMGSPASSSGNGVWWLWTPTASGAEYTLYRFLDHDMGDGDGTPTGEVVGDGTFTTGWNCDTSNLDDDPDWPGANGALYSHLKIEHQTGMRYTGITTNATPGTGSFCVEATGTSCVDSYADAVRQTKFIIFPGDDSDDRAIFYVNTGNGGGEDETTYVNYRIERGILGSAGDCGGGSNSCKNWAECSLPYTDAVHYVIWTWEYSAAGEGSVAIWCNSDNPSVPDDSGETESWPAPVAFATNVRLASVSNGGTGFFQDWTVRISDYVVQTSFPTDFCQDANCVEAPVPVRLRGIIRMEEALNWELGASAAALALFAFVRSKET